MTFMTHSYNIKLFVEVMSFNIMLLLYVIKYYAIYMNSTNVSFIITTMKFAQCAIMSYSDYICISKYKVTKNKNVNKNYFSVVIDFLLIFL